jgi:4-diphosphocytidyl-2-C-methyl-D-erythritol kinase
MLDSITSLVPAKLNIFLKVLGRKNDGYHIIRSGITFINLYDKLHIEISDKNKISYEGYFKPIEGIYSDCIIEKTLEFLNLPNNLRFKISVEKNIPVQGGLGSASTNAAGLIKALQQMKLIEIKEPQLYSSLGSDIPAFLYGKNCIVTGTGEKIAYQPVPKYFFLLVKPKYNNSTKSMYEKLLFKRNTYNFRYNSDSFDLNDDDNGNDFEKIVLQENEEFSIIMKYLEKLDKVIFSRMTGSGSCCYAVFENMNQAYEAQSIFKSNFSNLWTFVGENNIINN